MIARAIMFTAVAVLATATTASARPLLLSDLPPDVRALPNARGSAKPVTQSVRSGWHQEGTASWYGKDHAGRRTTSGETFNPEGLTAAHASLPLGTRLRVVREDTGESVVVTINDRIGTHRRVIDLSRGAAEAIGLLRSGVAQVRLLPDGDGDGVIVPAPSFTADADDAAPVARSGRGARRGLHSHSVARGHIVAVHLKVPSRSSAPHARHRA